MSTEGKRVITLKDRECSELIEYLMEVRNQRIEKGKPTDRVCDLMIKIIDSPPGREVRVPERVAR